MKNSVNEQKGVDVRPVAYATPSTRLGGLDLARFIAFVGMVMVNFKIVMGAAYAQGWAGTIVGILEGKAAATFVVLAGAGLGLAAARVHMPFLLTVKRATFLLVLGLLNMLIFDADILHYYAFYFLFGAMAVYAPGWLLLVLTVGLSVDFVLLFLIFDYGAGWNWNDLSYQGFWTPVGFVRNLLFNGWHPVVPWLSFFLFGIWLSRLNLGARRVRGWLTMGGAVGFVAAMVVSKFAVDAAIAVAPGIALYLGAEPIPPMPLYMAAGMGAACFVIGACLTIAEQLDVTRYLGWLTAAGRQTLTLYVAHILIGMGTLEALGLLGGQSAGMAIIAAAMFCAAAVVFAGLWSCYFKRGLLETLMRKIAG